jgi:dihydrofolate synthase / folylpolyglutamate synthase
MMTYEETLEFLFRQLPAYHRIGKAAYKGDLNTTLALDEHTGNPHKKYHTVHIAGTNGKGSVSHMTASILQEAGYTTGLYTSPHLKDFRERIRVNGVMIPKESVVDFIRLNQEILGKLSPSFFEMTVAMAFDHFAATEADVAVIEVGLGGRLDSTNIITPVLSLITNIGHDHMDLLGDTLEKVAAEKAGIIKDAVPVVVSETQSGMSDIFRATAKAKDAGITFADLNFSCILGDMPESGLFRDYTVTERRSDRSVTGQIPLFGDYQARNIQGVYCAVNELRRKFKISDQNVRDGIRNVIKNTGFAGRWQILKNSPLIVCDTAHNQEGIELVLEQIKRLNKNKLHIVLGFVNDKDLSSVLPLFPSDAAYYFTRSSIPRALDQNNLKMAAARFGLTGESYPDVTTAMDAAQRSADSSDIIFVGGSTFVVAEVV